MNTKRNRVLKAVRETQGRFFGLQTSTGRVFNAQLVRETPKSFRIFDRNNRKESTVLKTAISSVRSQGQTINA